MRFAALHNPPLPSSPLLHRHDPLFWGGGGLHFHTSTVISVLFFQALFCLVFIFYKKFGELSAYW